MADLSRDQTTEGQTGKESHVSIVFNEEFMPYELYWEASDFVCSSIPILHCSQNSLIGS